MFRSLPFIAVVAMTGSSTHASPLDRDCLLPTPDLSDEDWRSYFAQLYGPFDPQAGGMALPSVAHHNHVDVLNLTLLSNVSATAAAYVSEVQAAFPRYGPWGRCFNNACGRRHFMANLNVHCNIEFAWRLRMYKYSDAARIGHAPIPSGKWVEATHCGVGVGVEDTAAYFYAARGSGLWINVGRTIASCWVNTWHHDAAHGH